MKIEILGTESLGVRGLSCVVKTMDRKIIIDPGVALGYQRHGLLPHPFQVAVGRKVRQKIAKNLKDSTDVVISHFHGDHIPLVHANPYQLSARQVAHLFQKPLLWCKSPGDLSPAMARRCQDLSKVLGRELPCSEGKTEGFLSFSCSLPHGDSNSRLGRVMMTRIQDEREVFVHASDIQLLNDQAVAQILDWKPDIVLASGPPLYLRYLTSRKRKRARENAIRLSRGVHTLILDHHLLRSEEGYRFLKEISSATDNRVICAADYMNRRRLLLEAWRHQLYQEMPVPKGWHKAYASGRADTDKYTIWRGFDASKI